MADLRGLLTGAHVPKVRQLIRALGASFTVQPAPRGGPARDSAGRERNLRESVSRVGHCSINGIRTRVSALRGPRCLQGFRDFTIPLPLLVATGRLARARKLPAKRLDIFVAELNRLELIQELTFQPSPLFEDGLHQFGSHGP